MNLIKDLLLDWTILFMLFAHLPIIVRLLVVIVVLYIIKYRAFNDGLKVGVEIGRTVLNKLLAERLKKNEI